MSSPKAPPFYFAPKIREIDHAVCESLPSQISCISGCGFVIEFFLISRTTCQEGRS